MSYMFSPTNGSTVTVNGNIYAAPPGATVSVQSGDVAALQVLGWQLLSARLKAPSDTSSITIGTNGYPVQPDGTIWALPGDVAELVAAGCIVISTGYTAPAAPTPVSFTLQMQAASQSFQPAGGGSSYVSNTAGVVSGVEPQDVLGMIKAGGIIVSLTGPLGTFTYTGA